MARCTRRLAAIGKRLLGRVNRVEGGAALADEEPFGDGEMEKADLLGDALKPANEIGENDVEKTLGGMQLPVLVANDEKLAGRGGD